MKMNVFIVTPGTRSSYILVTLRESLRRRGVSEFPILPRHCQMWVRPDGLHVRYKGTWLPQPDLVVNGLVQYPGIELVEAFEAIGVPVVNTAAATRRADIKALTSVCLWRSGIAHPVSAFSYSADCWLKERPDELRKVIGEPVIAKPNEGSWERGVRKFASWDETLDYVRGQRPKRTLFQAFIRYPGHWYRIIVIGGKAVAGNHRNAPSHVRPEEWVKETRRGLDITAEQAEFAERVAATAGLDFLAVDICDGPDGFVVIELNAWPNCIDIDSDNQTSIAEYFADYIVNRATAGT